MQAAGKLNIPRQRAGLEGRNRSHHASVAGRCQIDRVGGQELKQKKKEKEEEEEEG